MRSLVLGKLKYKGEKKLLVNNQDVNDIMQQLLKHHDDYKHEYDKISSYFIRKNEEATLKAIFDFLKKHVKYVVETTENQKLKSPAGIVATGNTTGSDCKNYSLFINGIIDSLNRKGIFKIPFCYRFTSYRIFDKVPQHVFAVAYPKTKNEIWIDPVLPSFNERKSYTYKIDKKPNMALYSISGVSCGGDGTIGRRKRSERRAKRKARRKARRQRRRYGENCKGRTFARLNPLFVAGRKAFLLLVRLNFKQIGRKLYNVMQTAEGRQKVAEKWCKFGGNAKQLRQTVAKVEAKLRRKGKITGGITLGLDETMGYIGAVPLATVIASAKPIIIAMTPLLKLGAKFLKEGKAKEIMEAGSEAGEEITQNQDTGESIDTESESE